MKGEKAKAPKPSDEGGFFSRWSQRKRGGAAEPEAEIAAAGDSAVPAETGSEAPSEWSEDQVQQKLGEIEGMKQGDDFKPLLGAGIPSLVKRAALRKLWRSHPAIGFIDGLDDYNEDYTIKPGVVAQVRSAYRAGEGYVYDEEAETERQTEISARRDRDKHRARAAGEAAEKRGAESGEDEEAGGIDRQAAADAQTAALSDPADSEDRETESQPDSKPAAGKGRGRASARRWGGGQA
ncbi:MAG: DUF3306 domain-containing protein [Rhodovibrionaceae bacterium]